MDEINGGSDYFTVNLYYMKTQGCELQDTERDICFVQIAGHI